jgi:hypothetical protein
VREKLCHVWRREEGHGCSGRSPSPHSSDSLAPARSALRAFSLRSNSFRVFPRRSSPAGRGGQLCGRSAIPPRSGVVGRGALIAPRWDRRGVPELAHTSPRRAGGQRRPTGLNSFSRAGRFVASVPPQRGGGMEPGVEERSDDYPGLRPPSGPPRRGGGGGPRHRVPAPRRGAFPLEATTGVALTLYPRLHSVIPPGWLGRAAARPYPFPFQERTAHRDFSRSGFGNGRRPGGEVVPGFGMAEIPGFWSFLKWE